MELRSISSVLTDVQSRMRTPQFTQQPSADGHRFPLSHMANTLRVSVPSWARGLTSVMANVVLCPRCASNHNDPLLIARLELVLPCQALELYNPCKETVLRTWHVISPGLGPCAFTVGSMISNTELPLMIKRQSPQERHFLPPLSYSQVGSWHTSGPPQFALS